MPFREIDSLRVFQFDSLMNDRLAHGIFTRRGGVSPKPWHSLNVGNTVGDDGARVLENRRRVFSSMGRDLDSLYDVWQIHSAHYVVAREPRMGRDYQRADVILSDTPDLTLFMRFADCVPILLFDPRNMAIGLAHAGWMGTIRGAAQSAVQGMIETFNSDPDEIIVGLGPSIGPDHYQVGDDVVARIREAFPSNAQLYIHSEGDSMYLDLWAANRDQLMEAGIRHIETSKVCTACHTEDWYSHRAESGSTGRFGALIGLR